MAGTKGRSGRFGDSPRNPDGTLAPIGPRLAPSTPPPKLGSTIEEIDAALSWLWDEETAGNIDPRMADSLESKAKLKLMAIRTKHSLNELDELRALVLEQRRAIDELMQHEQRDRYSAGTGEQQSFGRVRMPPDGEPH